VTKPLKKAPAQRALNDGNDETECCNQCKQALIEIDNNGESLTGCLPENLQIPCPEVAKSDISSFITPRTQLATLPLATIKACVSQPSHSMRRDRNAKRGGGIRKTGLGDDLGLSGNVILAGEKGQPRPMGIAFNHVDCALWKSAALSHGPTASSTPSMQDDIRLGVHHRRSAGVRLVTQSRLSARQKKGKAALGGSRTVSV